MWKAISKFLVFILWFMSLCTGIILYVLNLRPELKNHFIGNFSHTQAGLESYDVRIIATILIIIPLILLLAKLRSKKPEEPLVYNTAEGPVVIESATLSDFVKSVIKSYEPVNHATVKTEPDNKKVNVIARVYLNDNQPVATVVSELQVAVRRRVHKAFGIDLLRDIRIEVARLSIAKHRERNLLTHKSDKQDNDASTDIEKADYKSVDENQNS